MPFQHHLNYPDVFGRPMTPPPAPLVYINGCPGVGKEVVAECLTLLLGRDKSFLVDAADGDNNLHQSSSPERSWSPLGADALASLLAAPRNTPRIAILASTAPDTPPGRATARTLLTAAEAAGRVLVPVVLTCEPAEHMRRAQSLQRQCSFKVRSSCGEGRGGGGLVRMEGVLSVDVTRKAAVEVALGIVEVVMGLREGGGAVSTPGGRGLLPWLPASMMESARPQGHENMIGSSIFGTRDATQTSFPWHTSSHGTMSLMRRVFLGRPATIAWMQQ
ncbi:hypothetical protein B0H67DRAFT_640181 [Lasiosphaeris hirsuta]|uniref:Uncharacterized protein n=1 Tax=Lasiosphaeris hirsuta TaxID=260670 RepID=A0AA40E875_9PEZI|nr:hypothetical protein B0H67DRAFT_640181 [Lasiosphaeris hirsuta]